MGTRRKAAQAKKERHQPNHQLENQQKSRVTVRRILTWSAITLGISAAALGFTRFAMQGTSGLDVTRECVTHGQLGMHIHPELSILINGGQLKIPANVGITSDCMRPIHTHDDSNKLHVEWTTRRDFTLGEFFTIWGKTFSKDHIFDYRANASHTVTLTVNGNPNKDFEKLVLKNDDKIVIEYRQR